MGFLRLPIEIRLYIYDLLIGPSECYATPAPYLCFSIRDNTRSPFALSRCGFRKWDFRKTPVWTKWPDHDAAALSLTCRQIHLDLSEDFHPPPTIYALTIVDDSRYGLVQEEKLYTSLNERSWLFSRLKIVRLELTVDRRSRYATRNEGIFGRHPSMDNLRRWSGRIFEEVFHRHRVQSKEDQVKSINKLAAFLSTLPQLRKVELYIRSTGVLKAWTNPFDDLRALHGLDSVFAVIIGPDVSIQSLKMFITSRGGELNQLNSLNSQREEPRLGAGGFSRRLQETGRMDMCIVSQDRKLVSSVYYEDEKTRNRLSVDLTSVY